MYEDLIAELKRAVPPRKKGGGFFSGPVTSVEYGTNINLTKAKNDMHLNGLDGLQNFEVAVQVGIYLFAIDRDNLYCKSSYTYAMDPPSENAHNFVVEQHTTSMAGINRNHNSYAIPLRKIESGARIIKNGVAQTVIGGSGFEYSSLRITLTDGNSIEFNLAVEEEHFNLLGVLFRSIQNTIVKDELLNLAKKHEKLLEFNEAAEIYKRYGMDDDVIRVRDEARNKIEQTVVHGDYVDDRDTIVKDSVLNRSNVGGGSSKMQELKDLTEMKKEGLIDDDEFKQMKKEILGK